MSQPFRAALRAAFRIARAAVPLILPAAAFAGAPVGYDGWSVQNGTIDASSSCSTPGVTCTTMVEDNGFLQQEVVTPNGRFYRTIMTETGATGTPADLTFTNENFVPVNGITAWDMNDKQVVRDPISGFENESIIARTPFIDNNGNTIDLFEMALNQILNDDQGMANDFHFTEYSATGDPFTGPVEGRTVDIGQETRLNEVTDPWTAVQKFDYRERSGWKGENYGGALLKTPVTKAGSLTLGDKTVTWKDGDTIASTWFAQVDQHADIDNFAYQSIKATAGDTGAQTSADTLTFDPPPPVDPFAWDSDNLGSPPAAP